MELNGTPNSAQVSGIAGVCVENWGWMKFSETRFWRREWDSNPRYGFPHTRFPSVRLKPLGHLSGGPLMTGQGGFCKGGRAPRLKFLQIVVIIDELRCLQGYPCSEV